jgi:hypothetical protein
LIAVLTCGRASELKEHVVGRRTAQPEVAHADLGVAQRGGGILDQLQREDVVSVPEVMAAPPP